jgi:hypothetical protein
MASRFIFTSDHLDAVVESDALPMLIPEQPALIGGFFASGGNGSADVESSGAISLLKEAES